ncbi:SDR family NAD(P)-dependent oxidoreductase [Pseudonocardia sp. RS010]|uniref:SDR family NAD(P)-dependent oxidoreductase n=1 Tax=Pseudonocardia sp. RS010 TaxID=3385979 RepID=UPI00399FEAF1
MSENTIALVTGADKGLGRETVRRLAALGWTMLLGSRDAARGAATAAELQGAEPAGTIDVLALDVTSDESAAAAAKEVEERYGRLDVLINNAGITGPRVEPRETGADAMREVFETNVFGPVRVTRAFLPLLDRSAAPRIVMVSSGVGSLTLTADPARVESQVVALTYPSSKSALNMVTTQYARALPRFRVNAADPGYTATDLNGHHGHQTVSEGTDAIVELAQVGPDGPTGSYRDRRGVLPW